MGQDKCHPKNRENAQIDDKAAEVLKKAATDSKITCAAAHHAAKALGMDLEKICEQIDLLELKLLECQLGLFGYPGGKGYDPDADIPETVLNRVKETAKDGRLSCRACWDIALELKQKRIDIGSACEKLELKISPCQLGIF